MDQDQDQNAKKVKEDENERAMILWDLWSQTVGMAGDNQREKRQKQHHKEGTHALKKEPGLKAKRAKLWNRGTSPYNSWS